MKVSVEVIKGPEKGRIFDFDQPDKFIVGRGKEAHFRISDEDRYVSRIHFMLEIAPPRVYFRELSQTNPSTINGLAVSEAELQDGDIIRVGYTQLQVSLTKAIETNIVYCLRCGISMEVMLGEPTPQFCSHCSDELERARKKKQVQQNVYCSCGENLSSLSDSDGRMAELQGLVQYICPKCAQEMQDRGLAGTCIDEYEALGILGEGHFGIVYKVYHRATSRVMALKLMKEITDPMLLKRFARETKYLNQLNHPHIIRYIDSGSYNNYPFLAMELCSHGTLQGLMMNSPSTQIWKVAVPYIVQALDGLAYLHSKSILHRDLKPDNMLLQKDPDGKLMVKISDLGLAKKYSEAGGSALTQLGTAMGTICFSSPEEWTNARDVREPSDIYSMGASLYYLLTGYYAFDFPSSQRELEDMLYDQLMGAKNISEAMAMIMKLKRIKHPLELILTQDPIPVEMRDPTIPTALAEAINKSMCKDPSKRYPTAYEFSQALQASIQK